MKWYVSRDSEITPEVEPCERVKVIEAEPALARIKELEERLKLLETQNAEFKDYFQMQHVVRHRR